MFSINVEKIDLLFSQLFKMSKKNWLHYSVYDSKVKFGFEQNKKIQKIGF